MYAQPGPAVSKRLSTGVVEKAIMSPFNLRRAIGFNKGMLIHHRSRKVKPFTEIASPLR
ncbi:hypothetical protein O9929_13670 [Vibrio lentus]|nr:hypothetical protein [Vibrio lentus]